MLSSQQQKILVHFENAIAADSLRHAYIIEGEKGMGKKYLCDRIQLYFACHTGRACGECSGCKSAQIGANPDIIRVSNGDKKNYEIDSVRALIKKVYERPIVSSHKLIIIQNAHALGKICQNALLKVIEEPPPYAVFILLCDNLSTILPTVLSRVMVMKLSMWSEDELRACHALDRADDFFYGYAMGNIGTLISVSSDEGFRQLRKDAIGVLCAFAKNSEYGVYDATEFWTKNKENIHDVINITALFLRDVIFFKTGQKELIVNKDELARIKNLSDLLCLGACLKMTETVGNIASGISRNENLSMAVQTMFMRLREVINDRG